MKKLQLIVPLQIQIVSLPPSSYSVFSSFYIVGNSKNDSKLTVVISNMNRGRHQLKHLQTSLSTHWTYWNTAEHFRLVECLHDTRPGQSPGLFVVYSYTEVTLQHLSYVSGRVCLIFVGPRGDNDNKGHFRKYASMKSSSWDTLDENAAYSFNNITLNKNKVYHLKQLTIEQ